jgi:hypothetical protein
VHPGSDYERSFDLSCFDRGAVPALPMATTQLLRQAARGEPVQEAELNGVIEAAQRLQDRLGFSTLT